MTAPPVPRPLPWSPRHPAIHSSFHQRTQFAGGRTAHDSDGHLYDVTCVASDAVYAAEREADRAKARAHALAKKQAVVSLASSREVRPNNVLQAKDVNVGKTIDDFDFGSIKPLDDLAARRRQVVEAAAAKQREQRAAETRAAVADTVVHRQDMRALSTLPRADKPAALIRVTTGTIPKVRLCRLRFGSHYPCSRLSTFPPRLVQVMAPSGADAAVSAPDAASSGAAGATTDGQHGVVPPYVPRATARPPAHKSSTGAACEAGPADGSTTKPPVRPTFCFYFTDSLLLV